MKYWEIENINANTFVGNEIKKLLKLMTSAQQVTGLQE